MIWDQCLAQTFILMVQELDFKSLIRSDRKFKLGFEKFRILSMIGKLVELTFLLRPHGLCLVQFDI